MERKRCRDLCLALVLLGFLAAVTPPVLAQVPADGDFLLTVRDLQRYPVEGEILDEVFLFRDGEMVFSRVGPDGADLTLRTQASAAQLSALNTILVEKRVGQQSGYCAVRGVAVPLPPGDALPVERDVVITWFGRGERLRHLPVNLAAPAAPDDPDATLEPCAPAVNRITEDLFGLLETLVQEATLRQGGPLGLRLLFNIHNAMQEDVRCGEGGFHDAMFLFRDGFFLRRIEDLDGNFQLVRSQATDEALGLLRQALAQQRVGVHGGVCRLAFITPFLVDGGCLKFTWQSLGTWHGRGERRAEYFGSSEISQMCSAPQQQVQRSVNDYVRNTLGQFSRHEVAGRYPVSP
jgi:hypothetical protein